MIVFSAQDLVLLAKRSLSLRLTGNTNEAKSGGFGDAIPLSHLAGANDIIAFLTLSFLAEQPRQQMEAIYKRYKQSDVQLTDCMPRLLLYYAAQHNIDDAKKRLAYVNNHITTSYIDLQVELIAAEAKKLASFYCSSKLTYPLELVVENLPYLAEELAYNFNEKLKLRLTKNYDVYATSDDMAYLFLTDNTQGFANYQTGYDFNHYPLGKTGSRRFNSSTVVAQVMFLGGENRTPDFKKNLEDRIFNAIKDILKNEPLCELKQGIELKLSEYSDHHEDFKDACNGAIALVAELEENQQLSPKASIDLLKQTASLIDNPAAYKTFLTEAKNYLIIDNGRLSAYMMLIAGWAAKIVTANYAGNAWIKLASEKLNHLTTIEECADASEAYSKRM